MAYTWSEDEPDRVTLRIPDDRPIYFISDLHLGDGMHSDIFMGKDRLLHGLLDEVRQKNARLVIVGDAIDFQQAWNMTRILQAHGKLLGAFSELADTNGVIYIYGNHDHDIRIYRDILRFKVCSDLYIGDDIAVQHGHAFDPFIGKQLKTSHNATLFHHGVERYTGYFLRMPLSDFYNIGMRFALWLSYYGYWRPLKFRNFFLRKLGLDDIADRSEFLANHWVRAEAGDPVGMTRHALNWGKQQGLKALICGHAHMPCNMDYQGLRYINTGSWTFGWAQYTLYEHGKFTVRDRLTGQEYQDELYQALMRGDLENLDFDRWWRNQYMGWLRYRAGEARNELQR